MNDSFTGIARRSAHSSDPRRMGWATGQTDRRPPGRPGGSALGGAGVHRDQDGGDPATTVRTRRIIEQHGSARPPEGEVES